MIEADGISKSYGDKTILRDLTIKIRDGEIVAIIGPSGSGKSTLLRMLDLIEEPTSGRIRIFGEEMPSTPAERLMLRRRMALLFQKPVIFNTSVYENIAIGLRIRGEDESTIDSRVKEALDEIRLTGYGARNARTLSGGEAQRVALARAVVVRPEILFLDEPTTNLDPLSTQVIEALVRRMNEDQLTTVVMATHDRLQGQRLADQIGVLMAGGITQLGVPYEVFNNPKSRDVAEFVGIENILAGTVLSNDDGLTAIDIGGRMVNALSSYQKGTRVSIFLRSEDVLLTISQKGKSSARNAFSGTIEGILPMGPLTQVKVDCGFPVTALVTRRSAEDLQLSYGKEILVSFKASAVHVAVE